MTAFAMEKTHFDQAAVTIINNSNHGVCREWSDLFIIEVFFNLNSIYITKLR